jgi:hypothetical protein
MNDRLEDFVRTHRDQFDPHEPDPSVWLKIRPAGIPERGYRRMRWLRVAAVIAVIFAGSAAGIYYLSGAKGEAGQYSSELLREIRETEQYYNRMVAQRYDELRPYLKDDPQARNMLKTDLQELDEEYEALKNDLQDQVSSTEVIEAMILNYRMKLEILEDLLNQLKEKETQDYEKNRSYAL